MRLWHEALLPLLPRQQLLGQHRECCALRGLSWGKRHAVVDYVFTHPPEALAVYHARVMEEMRRRGYHAEPCWIDPPYRGKRAEPLTCNQQLLCLYEQRVPVYDEHDDRYYRECLDNLKGKGIDLSHAVPTADGEQSIGTRGNQP